MNQATCLVCVFAQPVKVEAVVLIREKAGLPVAAALDDVQRNVRQSQTDTARHLVSTDITAQLNKKPWSVPCWSEVFYAFCKLQEMKTYASRRAYVETIYADVLLDLKRIQRHAPSSKNWSKANEGQQGTDHGFLR